jgi:multidrug transporter EmrE-like cation transporter
VLARAHALGTPAIVSSAGGLAEQAAGTDLVFDDDEGLIRAMKEAAAGVPARGAPAAQTARGADGRPARSDWDPEFQPPLEAKGRGMLFLLILVSVAFAALAQLTLKHGMTQVTDHGAVPLDLKQPVRTAQRIAGNVSVLAGLGTFVFSAAIWLLVLSRVSLSFAYPFVSLTYVIILVFDRVALHEQVTSLRWAGVALIVGGILLVSRTHQTA